jgi:hypothetical protein
LLPEVIISQAAQKMKVSIVGSANAETFKDVSLNISKAKNGFGEFYYFGESIYLIQKDGTTDYHIDQSRFSQQPQLSVKLSTDLQQELSFLMAAILEKNPELKFKPVEVGKMLYVKMADGCPMIAKRGTLQFTLRIFGCFKKASGDAYLQMEVDEAISEKFSLLTTTPNYTPNAGNWD